MADIEKIKNNVSKMVNMGAPEKDIDSYISLEGSSIDEVKKFNPTKNAIKNVAMAGPLGTLPKPQDIPGMATSLVNGALLNQPRTLLQYPKLALKGGPGAINMAAGANLPSDLSKTLNEIAGIIGKKTPTLPPVIPKSDKENILPQAVTPGGKIASSMLETGGNILAGEGIGRLQEFGKPPTKLDLTNKAEKLTTEVLQPSKGQIQNYYEQGKSYMPAKVASKYITESKSYGDLQNRLDSVIKGKMEEADFLRKRYNRPIGKTYIQPLEDYIVEQRRLKQIPDTELKTMQDVLDKEKVWAKRQRTLDTVKGQTRKEFLQKMTEDLLEHRGEGQDVSRDPARSRALDVLRNGLKEKIEISHPQIKANNSTHGALTEARNLIAGQRALSQKAVPPNLIEKIVSLIKGSKDIPGEVAKSALERASGLPSKTKNIFNLMQLAKQTES